MEKKEEVYIGTVCEDADALLSGEDEMSFSLTRDEFKRMLSYVVNGGAVLEWCRSEGVSFDELFYWMECDKARQSAYDRAVSAQNEWTILRVLEELRRVAFADIRRLYDESGKLLPMDQWPAEAASCVASIDVSEMYEGYGNERDNVGQIKKIKMYDKMKGLQMIGKNLQMFIDRIDHTGSVTLEDLVSSAYDSRANGRVAGNLPV